MEEKEIVYIKCADGSVAIMREGEDEAYRATPLYRVSRRDEPGQTFEQVSDRNGIAGLQAAFDFAKEDFDDLVRNMGRAGWDEGIIPTSLDFLEEGGGRWAAREYDTIGSDWMVEQVGWLLVDHVNGAGEICHGFEEVKAKIERDADNGWI